MNHKKRRRLFLAAAMLMALIGPLMPLANPADFQNRILAASTALEVKIPVNVITANPDSMPQGGVLFTLEEPDGSPLGQSVLVGVDQSAQLEGLVFEQPGEYEYRIQAVAQDPAHSRIEGSSDFRVKIMIYRTDQGLASAVTASVWKDDNDENGPKETITVQLDPVPASDHNPGQNPDQKPGQKPNQKPNQNPDQNPGQNGNQSSRPNGVNPVLPGQNGSQNTNGSPSGQAPAGQMSAAWAGSSAVSSSASRPTPPTAVRSRRLFWQGMIVVFAGGLGLCIRQAAGKKHPL